MDQDKSQKNFLKPSFVWWNASTTVYVAINKEIGKRSAVLDLVWACYIAPAKSSRVTKSCEAVPDNMLF